MKRLKACVKEPNKFEKPRAIGDMRSMRERKLTCDNSDTVKPLNKNLEISGINTKTRIQVMKMIIEKKENMLFINSLTASLPSFSLSTIKGTRTERETMEATVTKRKSGIRKAA